MKSLRNQLQNLIGEVVAFGYTKVSNGAMEVYIGEVEDVNDNLVFLQTDEGMKSFRLTNILNHEVKTYQ